MIGPFEGIAASGFDKWMASVTLNPADNNQGPVLQMWF